MLNLDIQKMIAEAAAAQSNSILANQTCPAIVVPNDYKVVSLEKNQPCRNRFRGLFKTNLVSEFAAYFEERSNDDSRVFISPSQMQAQGIVDFGDEVNPRHCEDKAVISLDKTAALSALLEFVDYPHSQQNVAEFLEDWQHNISAHEANGEPIETSQAIELIRHLVVDVTGKQEHEAGNFSASKSALEKIEVSSKEKTVAGFDFSCVPYHSLSKRTFAVRFSIKTKGSDQPRIIARLVGLEGAEEEMRNEFRDVLNAEINGEEAKIIIGNFES